MRSKSKIVVFVLVLVMAFSINLEIDNGYFLLTMNKEVKADNVKSIKDTVFGEHIYIGSRTDDNRWYVLEPKEGLILKASILLDKQCWSTNNSNSWSTSLIREYLNIEFFNNINEKYHGLFQYHNFRGSSDRIGLLTASQYIAYRGKYSLYHTYEILIQKDGIGYDWWLLNAGEEGCVYGVWGSTGAVNQRRLVSEKLYVWPIAYINPEAFIDEFNIVIPNSLPIISLTSPTSNSPLQYSSDCTKEVA